jgi:serine/threonine protein phosphatase PrpC
MMDDACSKKGDLEWHIAVRPFPGEEHCGDSHLVAETRAGWLLAVADGLGHGAEAAVASRSLVEVLRRHVEEFPDQLLRRCHEALKNTRGSAATVVTIDRRRCMLGWSGVGNVEGVLCHTDAGLPDEYITQRGGIVGSRIPSLQTAFLQLQDGDLLVLATDGIDSRFVQAIRQPHPPGRLADYILDHYGKAHDDAMVLVARYSFIATTSGGTSS